MLRDQRGFLEVYLLVLFAVMALSAFAVLTGIAFGAKKNADVVYQMLGEAVDFAGRAASRDTGGNLEGSEHLARQYFVLAFSRMTQTTFNGTSFVPVGPSPIKAPAVLEEFRYVRPGEPVPGGIARQPGFVATVNVPILLGNVPFIGPQFLDVRMRYYQPAGKVQL
ncbi:MAG: hypothetical protein L5656_10605 [Thermanaeromonas sp.]|uniref:hypothetical protein n=1 Tax=Thermanaeromonas sp. TaxID=2003697 RepID=UPI00243F43F4|nr:hypothetical protein [Thermanaeromonas sp.]MCG0278952.1 hypothetical protein [Thermanaeromonas sp.]